MTDLWWQYWSKITSRVKVTIMHVQYFGWSENVTFSYSWVYSLLTAAHAVWSPSLLKIIFFIILVLKKKLSSQRFALKSPQKEAFKDINFPVTYHLKSYFVLTFFRDLLSNGWFSEIFSSFNQIIQLRFFLFQLSKNILKMKIKLNQISKNLLKLMIEKKNLDFVSFVYVVFT